MYVYKTKIKLHETDAAGLLFFSRQFEIVHNAYEALLEKLGFGFATLIKQKKYFLPIVHAQADYKLPLFVGDHITVEVFVSDVGRSSLTFSYKIKNKKKRIVGTAKTIHVTIDKKKSKSVPLPPLFKKKIMQLYKKDRRHA